MVDATGSPRAGRRLIVNADDLGLSPGVNRGIFELAAQGVVSSASLLVTLPAGRAAWEHARETPLDVGLHLNLCTGRPLSPPHLVPSLVDRDGVFLPARVGTARLFRGGLRLAEVEREWAAQIELFLSTGLTLSHLDSHCQMHMYPGLAGLTFRLARRYGIPAMRNLARGFVLQLPGLRRVRLTLNVPNRVLAPRSPAPALYFARRFTVLTVLGRLADTRPLYDLFAALPPGVTELICHPGYVDAELRRLDPLVTARDEERALLASTSFRRVLDQLGIGLTTFRDELAAGRP